MTLLEELERYLENASAIANKDPSDLNHSNPGKVKRQFKERMAAKKAEKRLCRQIDIAHELEENQIPWTRNKDEIHLVLRDGTTHPFSDRPHCPDFLSNQIEAMKEDDAQDQKKKLLLGALDLRGRKELKWIRERLQGVSTPKFRSTFLVSAGLLLKDDEFFHMTEVARLHDMLEEQDGQYGPWFAATALGTAFIYHCYLAGNVPMKKGEHKFITPQVELEAIAKSQAENLEHLPSKMKTLAGII